MNEKAISTFLHFGYLPKSTSGQLDFLGNKQTWTERKASLALMQLSTLIGNGIKALKEAFRESLNKDDRQKLHILPLSGGLDSRAILGGLIENIDCNQIIAITYGTPKTWDYEIGRHVARSSGIRSESVDLSARSWKWDTSKIMNTAARIEEPVWLFDVYVNHWVSDHFGTEYVYWSGFMGDPLSGSHLLKHDSKSWKEAKSRFALRNRFASSLDLTSNYFHAEDCLSETPFINPNILCYDEQIDFGIRQKCLVKHIVLPKSYDYRTPFLHPEWVEFILNVPRCFRENQFLYKEILKKAYPQLFSLPTKTNAGLPLGIPLWRSAIRRGTMRMRHISKRIFPWTNWVKDSSSNYIDFNQGLRERTDLISVVYDNIQALKKRGIVDWIDINDLWEKHQSAQANYADILTLLASLEINIVAGLLEN